MNSYEHVIIGAGIIGLTTAFELMHRGVPAKDIALLDPQPISGATYYAGGMLAPIAEVQYQQEPLYPLMLSSAKLFPELLERVRAATPLPTGYRTESTFVVGADRADGTHLAQLTDHQNAHHMEVHRLTLREARQMEPGLHPQLAGVVEIPGDHQLNPRLYSAALVDILRQRGAQFITAKVTTISEDTVRTDSEAVGIGTCAYLCNGLGAAKVEGWFEGCNPLQLRPVRGDMVRLELAPGQQPPVGRVVRAFVEDRPVYIIPRTDGTIAIGATSREDARRAPAVDGVFTLLRDAIRILPSLEECQFLDATMGERPGTPDDLPYLGLVRANLVVSTGYFRHGIVLSSLGGRVGAELGLSQTTDFDISDCNPLRHAQP